MKKYKLFVISDEPYERLVYDGFEQKSLAACCEGLDDYVLTVNSLSKTFAMKQSKRVVYLVGRVMYLFRRRR